MCLDNRAEVSGHYINSQLRSLWENSQACVKKHGDGLKPTKSEVEYGTALSEFYFGKHNRFHPSKDDYSFYASFGCPRVEFVCNHEAILYLELRNGHYNVDLTKATSRAGDSKHVTFEGYTVAFRVEFTTHSIKGVSCKAIGNQDSYDLNLVVLDLDSSSFAESLSHMPGLQAFAAEKTNGHQRIAALRHYVGKHYLSLLKRAGYHVLHSLPDFDNLSRTQKIDYSLVANRSLTTTDIFGISVSAVNTYLKGLWLQAAAHIDEHGTGDDHSLYSAFYLAEHRTIWQDGKDEINFHAYFGPLQVQPLCKREVVVYLDIQDVYFYMGGFVGEAHHKFSDWKIALIVDVSLEESEGGSVKKLKLDLGTARYCEHLSVLTVTSFDDLILLKRLRTSLIHYLTNHYVSILKESHHHHVYHEDGRITHPGGGSDDGSEYGGEPGDDDDNGCSCEEDADCGHVYTHGHIYWGKVFKSLLTHSHSYDYDFVTSITQGSINKHFRALWARAYSQVEELGREKLQQHRSVELIKALCLADYVHEHNGHVHFAASFGVPQIQLVCAPGSQKVLVYFRLKDGYLKTLGANKAYVAEGKEHHFSDWTVAFEVGLKLRETSNVSKISDAIKEHLVGYEEHKFKQLVLDFSTAKFIDSKSIIPGLLDGNDWRLIRSKREALLHYFTKHYFPAFSVAGHDILYSIPVLKKGNTHSITSLKFQICPFTFGPENVWVEGLRGRQSAIFERNMIVFVGMTGEHALPSTPLPHSGNWVCGFGREATHGMVVLSRRSFLEAKILSILAEINTETTVVPSFSGVEDGNWILELTTWNKHPMKKNRPCKFKELSRHADGQLEFEWSNKDRWSYDHEGDEGSNGSYRVSCDTVNKVTVPSVSGDSCTIRVSGTVVLKLSFAGEKKDWHTEATAHWSSAITISSNSYRGVQVHVSPDQIVPHFTESRSHGQLHHSAFTDAFAHLKEQLPSVIDLKRVTAELKGSLEGAWPQLFPGSGALCVTKPTFNRRGDLLLSLQPYVATVSVHRTSHSNNGHVEHHEGWFRKITTKVEHVIDSQLSAIHSPPPTYSPPGSVKSKNGYFGDAAAPQPDNKIEKLQPINGTAKKVAA